MDVVARDSCGGITIFEVKSWTDESFVRNRLSFRQRRRLERVALLLVEELGCEVRLKLVLVKRRNDLQKFQVRVVEWSELG